MYSRGKKERKKTMFSLTSSGEFLFLFFIKAAHKRQAEHRCFSAETFHSAAGQRDNGNKKISLGDE